MLKIVLVLLIMSTCFYILSILTWIVLSEFATVYEYAITFMSIHSNLWKYVSTKFKKWLIIILFQIRGFDINQILYVCTAVH